MTGRVGTAPGVLAATGGPGAIDVPFASGGTVVGGGASGGKRPGERGGAAGGAGEGETVGGRAGPGVGEGFGEGAGSDPKSEGRAPRMRGTSTVPTLNATRSSSVTLGARTMWGVIEIRISLVPVPACCGS